MLKQRFPILKDEDFEAEERETIFKRLETKLNKSRAELESLFAELQLY